MEWLKVIFFVIGIVIFLTLAVGLFLLARQSAKRAKKKDEQRKGGANEPGVYATYIPPAGGTVKSQGEATLSAGVGITAFTFGRGTEGKPSEEKPKKKI